jgi:predicted nucleic acid-binding Zn ribbon protein
MATFDYLCERCGQEFEVEQRLSDPPLTECPRVVLVRIGIEYMCYGTLRRQIPSSTNFVLKGRGWAKDGYK